MAYNSAFKVKLCVVMVLKEVYTEVNVDDENTSVSTEPNNKQ